MPTHAARQAYTRWVLEDTRYQAARMEDQASPATGLEKERRVNLLAGMAKQVKDAWDQYIAAKEQP